MGWFSSLVGGVVGFFIGGPAGAVIGAGLGATKVGEKVVNTVLDFVLQPFMPKMPDLGGQSEAQRQQGVLVQTQGSTVNVPIVYGYRKVGGAVTFAETGSTNNRYLYVAYVFSEGLVEGLREVFIDDYQIPETLIPNLNAGQLVNITSDKYKGRVQMRWSPGIWYSNPRNSQVGSTVKGDIFAEAPSFTSDMIYNGMAVLFCRYEWKEIKTQEDADNNPFTGGIPQVQVSMLGKRVASLLVDSTELSPYDSNTVRYSTNPAEILLDYLRNPRYGKGLLNNDIDWTTWKRAARKCNQTVTYVASGIQGPILTMNMVVDTNSTLMNNTKTLLQNFRAYMPYVQGKYKLRIEDAGNDFDILSGQATIVQTFTKDDIVSDITFNGIEKSAKYNVVTVTYVDPDQKWSNQQVVFPETEAERQRFIDLDGGRENKYDITFGGITNYAIAKDMARLVFNKQRRQESCIFTATSKALELEPGDCIRIQSNILNFGTDPWRVVSVRINGDMTVDIGAVRNPDDIYPYARVGEEDLVLPTYVPKGSIIYFPGSQNATPVGLVPPINAVFPPNAAPVVTNPPPTVPTDPGGGGVGGGIPDAGPIIVEPTTPPTVVVPPTNNPPPPPPVIAPFTAALTLNSIVVTKFDNNSSYFTIKFNQPNDTLYSFTKGWWRINDSDPWKSFDLTEKGPPGYIITWTPGTPLPNLGVYEYFLQSYATDGRPSTFKVRGNFRAQSSSSVVGELIGVGSASAEVATEGWQLPASNVPVDPWYDDTIDSLRIEPILSGGVPQATRRLRLTMTQLTYTAGRKINPLITGVRVYYKQKDDTYWLFEDLNLNANIPAYTTQTWDLSGDFGPRSYPNLIYPGTVDNGLQTYNFNVRLRYKDGTVAKNHIVGSGLVEQSAPGQYSFIAFGVGFASGLINTSSAKQEPIPALYEIKDTTQDPNNTFNTASQIIPQIFSCFADATKSRIQWRFVKPASGRFRGFDIRWRPIIPGSDPDYYTVNTGFSLEQTTNNILFNLEDSRYSHSTKYQWQIVARYKNNAGDIVDADTCLFAEASIPFGIVSSTPLVGNYFSFEQKDSRVVLGEITAAFPAARSLFANRWIKKQVSANKQGYVETAYGSSGFSIREDGGAGQPRLNAWYQLEFQAPNDTFSHLVCYRRFFDPNGATRNTIGNLAKFYPLGAWEKVRIPRTTGMSYNSTTGFYFVNIRGPLAPVLFDSGYELFAGRTLFQKYYGPSPALYPTQATAPGPLALSDIYPYYGVGDKGDNGATGFAEFIFVLEEGGTEGTKGLRLTEFYTDMTNRAGRWKSEIDGIQTANIPKDEFVDIANYNGFPNGYRRNINEALTGIAVNQLGGNDTFASPFRFGVPRYNSSWTAFQYTLQNPVGFTSGTTQVW